MTDPRFTFRNVNEALPILADRLLKAPLRESRNGDMREILTTQIRIERPLEREVLSEARRASYPAQIAETMWVLAGRNDVEFLSHYLPRAGQFSDDGEVWAGGYGPRIRRWGGDFDQLGHVINLLNDDPETRRAVISIYDPAADSHPAEAGRKDIPCNDFLQFIVRDGAVHLSVFTRSNDVIWGWSGINQFEWSFLLQVVAAFTGSDVGSVTYNITSLHLYAHHFDKAEKIASEPPSPKDDRYVNLSFSNSMPSLEDFDAAVEEWFALEARIRNHREEIDHDELLGEIGRFSDPVLRTWLNVLADWWGLQPLGYAYLDTAPREALKLSPRPRRLRIADTPVTVVKFPDHTKFTQKLSDLHAEKHAAYGDSWKRRGEFVAILANIARKVDRLGVAGGGDTAADTAIDLLIYLIKYRAWLTEMGRENPLPFYPAEATGLTDGAEVVDHHLRVLGATASVKSVDGRAARHLTGQLTSDFDELESLASTGRSRGQLVEWMIDRAYILARHLDWKESNSGRSWKGYNPEDVEAFTGD